jgi:hypothetical protein
MFAFSRAEGRTMGEVTRLDLPLDRYLGAAARQGWNDSLFATVMRLTENQIYDDGPMMSPEQANKEYGLPTLKFDGPVRKERARLMNERKRAELDRQFYLDSADFFSWRNAAGMPTQMISSMLNPLDIGLSFLPIVGSAARAKSASVLGRASWRRALEHGLITEEALLQRGLPRVASPLIEGTVGQAVAEVPLAISNYYDKANYTPTDFVANILGSGIIAGGIHMGIRGAQKLFQRLAPDTREAMMKQAHEQFLAGEPIKVHDYVKIDENTIRNKVAFDEVRARNEAAKVVSKADAEAAVERILKGDEQVVSAAVRDVGTGEVHTGPIHPIIEDQIRMQSDDPHELEFEHGFVTDKGTFLTREQAERFLPKDAKDSELFKFFGTADSTFFSFNDRRIARDRMEAQLLKEGKSKDQVDAALKEWEQEYDARQREAWLAQPHVQEQVTAQHERMIQEHIDNARRQYDPTKALSDEVRAEIRRQVDAGKVLDQDVVTKFGLDPSDYPKAASVVKEQIAEVQAELESMELTPEERAQVEAVVGGPKEPTLKPADPNWQVTVQEPMVEGGREIAPGYVQIDDVTGGENHWSKSPETLRKEGYDVPELKGLKQGKYTMAEAMRESKKVSEVSMRDITDKVKNCILGGTDA